MKLTQDQLKLLCEVQNGLAAADALGANWDTTADFFNDLLVELGSSYSAYNEQLAEQLN